MYNERRRDPPIQEAVCLRCGWHGTPHHTYLRDENGDAALILTQKPCPLCGRQTTQLQPPDPVPIQLVKAIRNANLTADELLAIADSVRDMPRDIAPRELANRVPAASALITIASRLGDKWIELLVLAVTLIALYIQTNDAQRAHDDAVQAHEDARQTLEVARDAREEDQGLRNAGELSDRDVERLVKAFEQAVAREHGRRRS